MKYHPHDYQVYARNFIEEHPVSALLLDMGLGKTSITLSAIYNLLFDYFDAHKILIIAPLRVAKTTWTDEVEKWDHLKDIQVSVAVGNEKKRRAALEKQADIYIINRENIEWLVEKSNIEFDFDMVVIDELSSFKNSQSKRFRSLMKVRPSVKRIVGLTGTPSSNGLMDLFAEFKVLDMGKRLGKSIGQYREVYFRPDKMNGYIVYSYKPRSGAEKIIYNNISDITISMKACDYLNMPELISTKYMVEMGEKEANRYRELKEQMIIDLPDGEVTAANAATLTGKLAQMANGAIYTDEDNSVVIHDSKLDALEDIIEATCGKPILVSYWFKHDYIRICHRLDKLKIKYEKIDSESSIRKWNNGQLDVGLIHPASAGHGLNLQSGGSTMVWFGLTWSLELYQQTVARLYRQGQTESTVTIIHILTKGTIDERILKVLQEKDCSQSALIDAVKADLNCLEE